jgi:pre-60S factor REI1
MQSDWHRYNLKRRVASLPPLSSEVFNEKVLANRATAAATAARASFEKFCDACKKTFYSENAYINHLSSQKHRANVTKAARSGAGRKEDDSKSIMSSTFSLGEPAERASTRVGMDSDAEEEFQEVVEAMKGSMLEGESEPVSRRPTRPHHSSVDKENRPEHPLSPTTTNNSANSRIRKRDPLKECLFCSYYDFESLPECLDHMIKMHGLFLPEPNYITDMEGLIRYLNTKVNEEHQCLYCGRLKWSEDGIKTHMRDMSHCKIAYETEDAQLEIGQFYDFRSTYSDDDWDSEEDEDMSDEGAARGGGVKLGAKRESKTSYNGGEDDDIEEGEGWETDSTASSVPTDELGCVYVDEQRDEVKRRLRQNRHHSHTDTRPHRSTDGFHSHAHHTTNAVYYDDFELHLPSGRTAGHRSLNKIWRQNLRTYPTPEERQQRLLTAEESSSSSDEQQRDLRPSEAARERERGRGRDLMVRNEALGIVGLDDATKRQLRGKELKEQKRAAREQRKFQAKVAEKANQQKHFRDPLLQ